MTEAWTGRKYRIATGKTYEVLGEPFEAHARKYVPYTSADGEICVGYAEGFETSTFVRVIEPKFAVGERVEYGGCLCTIDAVSSKPNEYGHYGYIICFGDGELDICFDCDLKKVSE